MIRLAMLLVGGEAFRRRWGALLVTGMIWIGLGLHLIIDASDGELMWTVDVLGAFLALEGLVALAGLLSAPERLRRALIWRAAILLALGIMILVPLGLDDAIPDRVLYGLAFLIDGGLRVGSAWVVRFEHWPRALGFGLLQLFVALMVATNWPLHHGYVTPMVLGVILISSGWAHILLGQQLRRLPRGASITSLPLYHARNWIGVGGPPRPHAAGPVRYDPPEPMTLYVWTAIGSASHAQGLPVVGRYIAATDDHGVVSTGHAALEMLPDLYISHYPGVEIDRDPDDFGRILRAGRENDVPGRWIPNHAEGIKGWVEPDQRVVFEHYSAAALQAFWDEYRKDSTYNLTSRSCSTVTALAIDTALEGVLGRRWPILRFALLLFDPNLWLAAILRRRGATMAWTPGLVLDYARVMRALVAKHQRNWFARLAQALSGYKQAKASA